MLQYVQAPFQSVKLMQYDSIIFLYLNTIFMIKIKLELPEYSLQPIEIMYIYIYIFF